MGKPNMVAGKIVDYLRVSNASSNTDGIMFTTISLARICACTPPACAYNIRKLLNAKVLIIKKGNFDQGANHNPPYFVLADGYEQGDSWKEKLGIVSSNGNNPIESQSPRPIKSKSQKMISPYNVEVLKAHAETMTKLQKALNDNNDLREQLLTSLEKQKNLEAQIEKLKAKVENLRSSERIANVELINAQKELTFLQGSILAQEKRQQKLNQKLDKFNQ